MIISAIFKAIIFYIVFITIRGLLRGHNNYKNIKDQLKKNMENANGFGHGSHDKNQTGKKPQGADIIEADYRVID